MNGKEKNKSGFQINDIELLKKNNLIYFFIQCQTSVDN